MIVGLFTELLGGGGIERAGRHSTTVLKQFSEKRGWDCRLLSLNDLPGEHLLRTAQTAVQIRGFGRRKIGFVRSALACIPKARLVYLNHVGLAPIGLLFKLARPKVRCVIATHGVEVWGRIPRFRRWALRAADAVTAPSRFTASKIMAGMGARAKNVSVLPWATDPAFLSEERPPVPAKTDEPPARVVLTVARLEAAEKHKGVDTVLQAFPEVLRAVPDAQYVIVGDGTLRPHLERMVSQLGLGKNVTFAGRQRDADLRRCYEACAVYAMPSGQEGFGMAFLEAMALGKPVIGGNYGGTPEIVTEGITGFLVEPGDTASLADRLIRLLTDGNLRRRMGEAGRRRVERDYTLESFRRRFDQILTLALEGR